MPSWKNWAWRICEWSLGGGLVSRAVPVPLTPNKSELAAKDAICRELTT